MLIIEIKNSYHAQRDKLQLIAKKQTILNKGYNYIMIVDKDYSEFYFSWCKDSGIIS